eukprot:7745130-Pyramimonas_sp.AAC.1
MMGRPGFMGKRSMEPSRPPHVQYRRQALHGAPDGPHQDTREGPEMTSGGGGEFKTKPPENS